MSTAARLADAIRSAILEAAVTLRPDVRAALGRAVEAEPSERGRSVLRQLLENADVAASDGVPLCQDTGSCWVRIEMGEGTCLPAGLRGLVDGAVAAAYREGGLRSSMVRDAAFDRTNTGDNTPAILELGPRERAGFGVDVMLKGGGSDNASALAMLPPSAGLDGARAFALDLVAAKASAACPPLVVGVAIGGTFDTVAGLSKKALLSEISSPASSEAAAGFEAALLDDINATGIGPAGLGGRTTALAVRLITAPCHIAALPVAVSMGCCAMRSAHREVA